MRLSSNQKYNSFRHISKSSASMYECSRSKFFRTTTEIQLGPDAFDESRFVITFLTILEVTEISRLYESSRLDFLEKFLGNNFVSSDAEENTSRPLNRGGIANLPLLRTLLAICQKSQEQSF